ncbi:MAG: hypothetical protein GC181_08235 [Bacteroidetes bacterium]|nr:hypothetical protein [Bacteroidota bacterium]
MKNKFTVRQIGGLLLSITGTLLFILAPKPENIESIWLYILICLQWFISVFQFFRKISVTPVFVLIICWTLLLITQWPSRGEYENFEWEHVYFSLSALVFTVQSWLIYLINHNRW